MLSKEDLIEYERFALDVKEDKYVGAFTYSEDVLALLDHILEQESELAHVRRALELACEKWQSETDKCPKHLGHCPHEMGYAYCANEKVSCAMRTVLHATKDATNARP